MAGIIDNEYGIIDQRTVCPYNKSHVVPVERMAKHLAKCRLQNSDANYEICPFDASHHVRKEDFQNHIVSCKGKDTIEKSIYKESAINLKTLPAHANVNHSEDAEENWDSDLPQATYDPKFEALYKPFFRQVPLELGASGKKRWRKVEEERVARIKTGACINDLEFPTVEGGVKMSQEITKQSDIKKEIPEASRPMSKHKSLMRVDLPPTLSTKTKTNSGFKTGEGNSCSSPLSVTDCRQHKGKKNNKFKFTEMASEVDSIFAPFSKAKPKTEKENIQPSKNKLL